MFEFHGWCWLYSVAGEREHRRCGDGDNDGEEKGIDDGEWRCMKGDCSVLVRCVDINLPMTFRSYSKHMGSRIWIWADKSRQNTAIAFSCCKFI